LDAKTGVRVAAFGNEGAIDLKQNDDQEFCRTWLRRDRNSVGAGGGKEHDHYWRGVSRGYDAEKHAQQQRIRAGFDVRTGKRLWIFHTIPKKGELGYDTWLNGSAEYTGNTEFGHRSRWMKNWD